MPRFVAIDLGAHAVKATVWNSASRRQALEERVSEPVPSDGAASPPLAARLMALDNLLRAHPQWASGGAAVMLAWPGEFTTLHRMTLPFTDRAQVEKTLPFAVEAEVPFDLDLMTMGSRLVVREKDTEALVAFTRKEGLKNAIDTLAGAGLDPRHVVIEPDALALYAPEGKVTAVIDVGHAHTSVSVARGGKAVVGRSITVAGRHFTQAIATALEVPLAEAQAIKHGEKPADANAVKAALDPMIGLLLAELRSTLIAAEDAMGAEIEAVFLTGGGARLEPLGGFISDSLGLDVNWLATAEGEPVPLEFALCDGMAARLAGQGRGGDIELRSGDLAWRGGFDVLRVMGLYVVPLVAFFCLTMIVVSAWQWQQANSELSKVNEDIRQTVIKTMPDVDESKVKDGTTAKGLLGPAAEALAARAEVLDRTDNTPPTVDKLKALTEAFPPPTEVTVEVTQLTITPENISFDAVTDGYASSSKVEDSLKAAPRFKQAAKGNEKKNRDQVTFTMTIPLTGAGAAAADEGGQGG